MTKSMEELRPKSWGRRTSKDETEKNVRTEVNANESLYSKQKQIDKNYVHLDPGSGGYTN